MYNNLEVGKPLWMVGFPLPGELTRVYINWWLILFMICGSWHPIRVSKLACSSWFRQVVKCWGSTTGGEIWSPPSWPPAWQLHLWPCWSMMYQATWLVPYMVPCMVPYRVPYMVPCVLELWGAACWLVTDWAMPQLLRNCSATAPLRLRELLAAKNQLSSFDLYVPWWRCGPSAAAGVGAVLGARWGGWSLADWLGDGSDPTCLWQSSYEAVSLWGTRMRLYTGMYGHVTGIYPFTLRQVEIHKRYMCIYKCFNSYTLVHLYAAYM